MPYKERQKQGEARKRRKPGYRVTNARAYNQSLRKRGMISLYVPDGDLKAQFINPKVRTPGVSGREPTYTAAYIELIYTFYRLFGWGMRQTTGYMEDFWATRGLDIPVPHKATRTPWRKMHLSIDADMNVHGIRITTTEVSDSEGMDALLPADLPFDRVIADGAYYSIERTEALSNAGVTPVIPPPAHAVVHGNDPLA
jgi:hypothetical protein